MDIGTYFERLGIAGVAPTVEGLAALQGAQMRAITFENIDPLLGKLPDVRLEAVYDKLVVSGRGGYCFELNTLFEWTMQTVGFDTRRVLCRVRNGAAQGGPRSHLAFVVTINGDEWLADTGFGGPGASVPLRIAETQVQDAPTGKYRFWRDPEAGETVLDREGSDGWFSLFGFDDARATDADIASANFVCARAETAPFPWNLMMSRHLHDGRLSLFNTAFRSERSGKVEKRIIENPEQLHALLTGDFALPLERETSRAIWDRLEEEGKLGGEERKLTG